MKKVVRMLGLCALVALAFTACKKDDTSKVSFTATITQPTSNARTHAVGFGHHLVWDAGDQIKVFNTDGSQNMNFTLPTDLTSAQQATFEVVGNDEVSFISQIKAAPYYAFYPNANVNGERVEMVIPATQNYVPQLNFANNLYPMVGFNVDANGAYCDNFTFVSNAGFLNVEIACPEVLSGICVTQLVLTSKDPTDKLSGVISYNKQGSGFSFAGENNVITMTPETPVALTYGNQRDFTFVLPEGALSSGFDLVVYLDNGETRTYSAPANENTIEAMTYTNMPRVSIGNNNQIVILP